jgi:segregation and condensation protein A
MRVNLPIFEGPLDMLLYLIKKNEFDIFDIPISQITQEYLEYLDAMEKLNMEIATEFIVMAVKLLQIKVMMLLREESEEETEDPRKDLVSTLIFYQAFKEVADFLLSREILNRDVFLKPPEKRSVEEEVWTELSPSDLMLLMKDILKRMKKPSVHEVEIEKVSVVEKIKFIIEKTTEKKTIPFEELVEGVQSIMHLIAFILAILELMRLQIIKVVQMRPFGKIMIYRTEKKFDEEILKGIDEYGERGAQESN